MSPSYSWNLGGFVLSANGGTTISSTVDSSTDLSKVQSSIVTYDAVLKLKGVLGVSDPLLKLAFNRIGDRAAAGLVEALDGEVQA